VKQFFLSAFRIRVFPYKPHSLAAGTSLGLTQWAGFLFSRNIVEKERNDQGISSFFGRIRLSEKKCGLFEYTSVTGFWFFFDVYNN
jgi:hypothetical protein